jgi:hypothetical protein
MRCQCRNQVQHCAELVSAVWVLCVCVAGRGGGWACPGAVGPGLGACPVCQFGACELPVQLPLRQAIP